MLDSVLVDGCPWGNWSPATQNNCHAVSLQNLCQFEPAQTSFALLLHSKEEAEMVCQPLLESERDK